VFVAVAGPTLSVDRLLGHSFKTGKVSCDCLKVGRDEVETYFQAIAWHSARRERMAYSCRLTDSVGLAIAINTTVITYECSASDAVP